jgi:hypothetical protein
MMSLDDLLDPTVGLSVLMFLIAGMILRSKRPKVPLWSLMAFTAFVVVISGLVPLEAIAEVIDMDVVLFLIGIFSIVAVAESSGLLDWTVHFLVSNPRDVLRRVDWGTIVFFMAMFITMSGVWKSGGPKSLAQLINAPQERMALGLFRNSALLAPHKPVAKQCPVHEALLRLHEVARILFLGREVLDCPCNGIDYSWELNNFRRGLKRHNPRGIGGALWQDHLIH